MLYSKQKYLFQNQNRRQYKAIFRQILFTLILTIFIMNINSAQAQPAIVHFEGSDANNVSEIEQSIRNTAVQQDFSTITAIVAHRDLLWSRNMETRLEVNGVSQTVTREGQHGLFHYVTSYGTVTKKISCLYNCFEEIIEGREYKSYIEFKPIDSAINAVSLGTEIKFTFTHRNTRGQYFEITVIYIREDLNISWRTGLTGSIIDGPNNNDTFSTQIADVTGYFENESNLGFELWVTEGQKAVEKYTLTKSEAYSTWSGTEWNYNSSFGQWYIQSFSDCPSVSDGKKCSQILFIPDQVAINQLSGKVTLSLRGTRTLGNQNQIEVLNLYIYGRSITTYSWEIKDSERITTDNQLNFNDVVGSAQIFKRKTDILNFDATEIPNQITQSFDNSLGASETINSLDMVPLGDNFKYGKWYVEESFVATDELKTELFHSGNIQFLFRPDATAINNPLNTDGVIVSRLKIHIHEENNDTTSVHTATISVSISRETTKPILSIHSKFDTVTEGGIATFTLKSNFNPVQPLPVSYIPSNTIGAFLESSEFPPGFPQTEFLTFSQTEDSDDWTAEIVINLRSVDGIDTEDGSITITLVSTSVDAFYFVAVEPDNSATVIIKDAEFPTLALAESIITVTEEDVDKNVQLTLNLSESINEAVNISYSVVAETATGGADFIDLSNGSVSILPNTASIPINIQIKGDELSEGDETFKVIIADPPSNAYFHHGISTLEVEVTIVDDEPIIMNVATTDFKVVENVINGNFIVDVELTKPVGTATSNAPTPNPVSFLVETSSDTATLDADFKTPERDSTQPRFMIPLDSKAFSFTIPIVNDVNNEGNETLNLRIYDLQQATFADGTREQPLKLTIIDNEKPTLTFKQNTITVEEEDTDSNVELTFILSGPIEEPVDIAYELIGESANEGTDFVDSGNGVVSIASNTKSIPISIQIKGDDINEGDETFKVRVKTPPENAAFLNGVSILEATIKIIDDESPILSVDNSTLTISERAEMTHIGLTLTGPTNEDVVVTYSTSITGNDTAQQVDFTAQSASTITISSSPPATSGLIQIPIINDTDEEEDETFTLTLTEVTGAVFTDGQSSIVLQITIIDDEGLPLISIDSTEIAVNEQNGYAEIDLSFTTAITEPVTIVYSTIQDTAVGGVDYTIQTNATLEIITGNQETIFIPITNDNIFESEEEFSIEISAISGAAYGSGVINTAITITITDDETEPTITIAAYSCEYAEPIPTNFSISESIGNLIFNAKLNHPSQNPVTFNYSTTADTATGADFYVSSATQYTIQPGSFCTEIVTPITHDILFEEDEQFNVTFTSEIGTNIIPPFKVKIEDDDIAIWSIEDLAMNEGDSDTEMSFRVYLSTPVYQTVRVKWTASTIAGDTATFGEDYAADHNSYTGYVTVLAGRIEGSIVGLEITGDTIFEPDETFTIILSDPEEGTLIGDRVAIGTIINDDPEPTLSISTVSQVSGN